MPRYTNVIPMLTREQRELVGQTIEQASRWVFGFGEYQLDRRKCPGLDERVCAEIIRQARIHGWRARMRRTVLIIRHPSITRSSQLWDKCFKLGPST